MLLLSIVVLAIACNGNTAAEQPLSAEKIVVSKHSDPFMDYLKQVVGLKMNEFNTEHIKSINRQYAAELPLALYDGQHERPDSIQVSVTAGSDKGPAELILLLPPASAARPTIGTIIKNFGKPDSLPKDFPMPKDPLPLRFTQFDKQTELTVRSGANQDASARVETIVILKKK